MTNVTLVTTYCGIPIYFKRLGPQGHQWLKWEYGDVVYGVLITNLSEALIKAESMIDAMLALELDAANLDSLPLLNPSALDRWQDFETEEKHSTYIGAAS